MQIRCARSGAKIVSLADISPNDSIVAVPEGYLDDPTNRFTDDPSYQKLAADAISLGQLSPGKHFIPISHFSSMSKNEFSLLVAVDPQVAHLYSTSLVGKRFLLRIYIGENSNGNVPTSLAVEDNPLLREWRNCSSKVGVHPHLAPPIAYYQSAIPDSFLPHLPEAHAVLGRNKPDNSYPMLLSEPYISFPEVNPFMPPLTPNEVMVLMLGLFRAAVHLMDVGLVHKSISPRTVGRCMSSLPTSAPLLSDIKTESMPSHIVSALSSPSRVILGDLGNTVPLERGSDHRVRYSIPAYQAYDADSTSFGISSYYAHCFDNSIITEQSEYIAPEIFRSLSLACSDTLRTMSGPQTVQISYAKAASWSIAATVYSLVMGKHPWSSASQYLEAVTKHEELNLSLKAVPPLPVVYPRSFQYILYWLLQPLPSLRLSPRAAIHRLTLLLSGTPMTAHPFLTCGVPIADAAAHDQDQKQDIETSLVVKEDTQSSFSAVMEAVPPPRYAPASELYPYVLQHSTLPPHMDLGATYDSNDAGFSPQAMDQTSSEAETASVIISLGIGLAPDQPTRQAVAVPYNNADTTTVAYLTALATDLFSLPKSSPNTPFANPSPTYSLHVPGTHGGKIDPMVPVHLLSPQILGSVLSLQYELVAPAPPVFLVKGYGIDAPLQLRPNAMAAQAESPSPYSHYRYPGSLAGEAMTESSNPLLEHDYSANASRLLAGGDAVPVAATPVFSRTHCAPTIALTEGCITASTDRTWGTALLDDIRISTRPGEGIHLSYTCDFHVKALDSGTGAAIGLVDLSTFDPKLPGMNLGETENTWCYSRTGYISKGTTRLQYGEPWSVGDIITLDVSLSVKNGRVPTLRFYKNGVPQGIAYSGPDLLQSENVVFAPAISIGSPRPNAIASIAVHPTEAREFDCDRAHSRIQFNEDGTVVSNNGKWATALTRHPGIERGKFSWTIRLTETTHGAGVALGVVSAKDFHWDRQNLGASPYSWCYSKTGKKGDGNGFKDYGRQFSSGDTVCMELDMDNRTLSFSVNGESQGVAYSEKDGIGAKPLVPAVCIGSSDGSKVARVVIVRNTPPVRRFCRYNCSPSTTLLKSGSVASSTGKWGTVFLEHPGIQSGRYSFAISLTSAGAGCGAGIGFADMASFDAKTKNLGVGVGSWCYSKTGKFSGGVAFTEYGRSFTTGDIVTAEVDMDNELMTFYVNGEPQGTKSVPAVRSCRLVPAVVLGSSKGGFLTQLSLCLPAVTRFDANRMSKHMVLPPEHKDTVATTDHKWCTVVADHPGVTTAHGGDPSLGILRFAVLVEQDGGAAIGFAEPQHFKQYAQNLGASPMTWAISKTGKVSSGGPEGFQPFSEKFGDKDIIGCEADLIEGIIRFWKNGSLLGTAFRDLNSLPENQPEKGRPLTLVPAVCLGSNSGGKPSVARLVPFETKWLR